MKKLALVLLGVLIGVVGSHLMKQEPQATEIEKSVVTDESNQNNTKVAQEPEPVDPKGLISVELAKEMSKAYDSRYHSIVESHFKGEKKENRSVWFPLSEIQNYITYAQNKAVSAGFSKKDIDGLRIYLAAYKKNKKYPEHPGMTTVFIVPTMDSEVSKAGMPFSSTAVRERDFTGADPLNLGNAGDPPSATYPQ